jgi:hypothetical protein
LVRAPPAVACLVRHWPPQGEGGLNAALIAAMITASGVPGLNRVGLEYTIRVVTCVLS